ncbi:MAG: Gfo/Idh/MocA family oxidoreductase, partial [Oscillospiraceae bacterium]|nr:Gfo/Idh/MocA family oxidoreductase [Oscillospiraceae bacterium]
MKVLFVGLGSIGRRHLKNLFAQAEKRGLAVQADALRHGGGGPLPGDIKRLVHSEYTDAADLGWYDAVFITNPTQLHFEAIAALSEKTGAFFIEKPIFESGAHTLEEAGLKGKKAYIAAPMRFCKTYMELKKRLPGWRCCSARVICSSYLPQWRPGVDYRTVYSAKKELGGGVTIDLIHEWDYLTDLFGFPLECRNFKGRYSQLEIDSDDLSVYIARYPDMLAEVHLDYIGRGYRRSVELLTDVGNVTADFGEGKLTLPDGETVDCAEELNERYLREMAYFLDYLAGAQTESV